MLDFAALFAASTAAAVVVDRELRVVAVNDAWRTAMAIDDEVIVGRSLFEVLRHDGPAIDGLRDALARVFETGIAEIVVVETWQPPGGAARRWNVTLTPLLDSAGAVAFVLQQPVHIAMPAVDVDVDASDAERRLIAESLPLQAWSAQPDSGDLDFVNGRVLRYFGVGTEQILSTGWLAHVHDDDRAAIETTWRHALRSGDGLDCELRLRRHDGQWRWHLARAEAMRDDGGTIVKWYGTHVDIHDHVEAREQLRQRADFEQKLIGIVSHDLRNPLSTIGLSAAVLGHGHGLDDKQRAAVERVRVAADRATRLISDLLDFSQARAAGTIPIHPEQTRIEDVVRVVVDDLRSSHSGRTITVEHSGDDVIEADHDRLLQVVDNLVGNALQHSPASSAVFVSSRIEGDNAVVDIKNEGTVPAHDLPRLFRPFQRGVAAKSTGRSVGLGLYIAARIVEAHKGTIAVTSTGDNTTCFTVRLPRRGRASPALVSAR